MTATATIRPYKRPPTLVPESPIIVARELPRQHGPSHTVELSIHPDLRVVVTDLATHTVLLRGRYGNRTVDWYFVGPTLHDERALLASDVGQVLRIFEEQWLDVRCWTSNPRTAQSLS
jgi:hypothetical protein